MKIFYDEKTDFLEFFYENDHNSFYEDSVIDEGSILEFLDDDTHQIIGYGFLQGLKAAQACNLIDAKTKLALMNWVIKKKIWNYYERK